VIAGLAAMITAMLLQGTLIAPLTQPIPISLPAVLVAVIALADGPGVGMSFGFAAGFLADLGSSHPAGVLALAWTGLGVVCGMAATRRTARQDALTAAICSAVATSFATGLLALVHSGGATWWPAVRDLVPTTVGDAVLALVVVVPVRAFLRTEALRAPRPVLTELKVARHGQS
jgi:rod shape-determining protein MreD